MRRRRPNALRASQGRAALVPERRNDTMAGSLLALDVVLIINDNQPLCDELVSRLEEKIPAMAKGTINAAYINTLAAGLSVMEVMNGVLVDTTADGQHKVIRVAKPKHKIASGRIIKVRRF